MTETSNETDASTSRAGGDPASLRAADLNEQLARAGRSFSGTLGVCALDLRTGRSATLNADRSFPTASTFKVAVMVEAFAQARSGRLDLRERVDLAAAQQVPGTGVLADLDAGLRPTLHDLVVLMIILSDNTATNLLLEAVGGVSAVNAGLYDRHQIAGVILHRPIIFDEIRTDARRLAEATPRALAELMRKMATGTLVSPEFDERMLEIMRRQVYVDQAVRYLDAHRDRAVLGLPIDVQVASKTGVFPSVRADVGAITGPPGAIAYAIMTEGSADTSNSIEHEGMVLSGRLGRLLFDTWWPEVGGDGYGLNSLYLGTIAE